MKVWTAKVAVSVFVGYVVIFYAKVTIFFESSTRTYACVWGQLFVYLVLMYSTPSAVEREATTTDNSIVRMEFEEALCFSIVVDTSGFFLMPLDDQVVAVVKRQMRCPCSSSAKGARKSLMKSFVDIDDQ
jgi:hypothetical protein